MTVQRGITRPRPSPVRSRASWADGPLLGFDLETTGVNPYECRMVDMALVLDRNDGSDPVIWQWIVNPGDDVDVPLECTAIHGLSTEYVRSHGIPTEQAVSELRQVIIDLGDLPPVAVYNASYDIPILLRESRMGAGLDWLILDGMVLDKYADPFRPGKRTLTSVSAAYGLGVRNAHRAAGDCISAINVTRAIGRKYPRIGYMNTAALQRAQADAYREQMEQFSSYQRKHWDEGFECSLDWPIDMERLKESL